MKTLNIAKLELNNLMYSPIAWLVLVGFSIYSAFQFVPLLDFQVVNQSLYNTDSYHSLYSSLFSSPSTGFFSKAATLFMVLIPLIAMGVISREVSSGSIKLLYSSPVKMRSIVLGKYMAVMTFVSFLMLIILLMLSVANMSIVDFDLGSALSGFIIIYCFAATVAAIAVYVSAFSAYPIVDAVATIALVYGLDLLYGLVKDVPIISSVMYWVAPKNHMTEGFYGLLTSKALGYFIVLISLFLYWSIAKMNLKRQTIAAKRITRLKMLTALVIGMGLIGAFTQPQWMQFKDLSANQVNQIGELSKKSLAPLQNKPLKVTSYINILSDGIHYLLPNQQIQDRRKYDTYYLFFPHMQMEYVYYFNPEQYQEYHVMRTGNINSDATPESTLAYVADLMKLDVSSIVSLSDLPLSDQVKKQYGRKHFRIMESEGQQELLMMKYNDMIGVPMEKEKSTAFRRLINKSYTIAFAEGHGERTYKIPQIEELEGEAKKRAMSSRMGLKGLPHNYDRLISDINERNALINNGFDLISAGLLEPVSEEVDILVIADPETAYNELELKHLSDYVSRGGHLLITANKHKQSVMNPIVEQFGVEYLPGLLVNDNKAYAATFNLAEVNDKLLKGFGQSKNLMQLINATALQLNENSAFNAEVFLSANKNEAWIDEQGPDKLGEITYQPEEGDRKETLPLAVQLSRSINGKEQKVFIASGADFMSNQYLNSLKSGLSIANGRLMDHLAQWYTNGEYPMHIKRVEAKDKRAKISFENMTYLKLIFYLLLPGIFAVLGITMLIKRVRN